jgi:hypothetical protein
MHSRIDVIGSIKRIVFGISLLVLLIGCGSSVDKKPSAVLYPTPTQQPQPISSPQPMAMIAGPSSFSVGFDVSGLLHIQTNPIECTFSDNAQVFHSTRGNLVLTNDPSTYSSSELQQIRNYLGGPQYQAAPPPTLNWIQGGNSCSGGLQITNISKTTLQLLNFDMRLMTTPQLNNKQYRLIDICPFETPEERLLCGAGPQGAGQSVHYDFQFENAPVGHSVGHVFPPQTSFIEILLKPTDTLYIDLGFTSRGTPDNFMYQVMPELTLATGPIELMTEQLFFADKSQFSCNTLQGNRLISVPPAEYGPTTYGQLNGRWCL